MKNKILEWKKLTNQITEQWITEYFQLSEEEVASGIDYYWIGNEFAGTFEFADYYIDFSNVLDCYKLNVSKEQFFDWYSQAVEGNLDLSLADFILSPEKLKEKQEKSLQESKERIIFIEQEFKKLLEEYGK